MCIIVAMCALGARCPRTICLRDSRSHAATAGIPEEIVAISAPDSRGLRDSRHRCTTLRLTPSAMAASRSDRSATASNCASQSRRVAGRGACLAPSPWRSPPARVRRCASARTTPARPRCVTAASRPAPSSTRPVNQLPAENFRNSVRDLLTNASAQCTVEPRLRDERHPPFTLRVNTVGGLMFWRAPVGEQTHQRHALLALWALIVLRSGRFRGPTAPFPCA